MARDVVEQPQLAAGETLSRTAWAEQQPAHHHMLIAEWQTERLAHQSAATGGHLERLAAAKSDRRVGKLERPRHSLDERRQHLFGCGRLFQPRAELGDHLVRLAAAAVEQPVDATLHPQP